MFEKILKTAYESGGEVIVQFKDCCPDQYKGRIQELNEDHFSLFHSGPNGGILWAFKQEDIAFCGLVIELPTALSEMGDPNNVIEVSQKPHRKEVSLD